MKTTNNEKRNQIIEKITNNAYKLCDEEKKEIFLPIFAILSLIDTKIFYIECILKEKYIIENYPYMEIFFKKLKRKMEGDFKSIRLMMHHYDNKMSYEENQTNLLKRGSHFLLLQNILDSLTFFLFKYNVEISEAMLFLMF